MKKLIIILLLSICFSIYGGTSTGLGYTSNINSFSIDAYVNNMYVSAIQSYAMRHGYPIDGCQSRNQYGYSVGYINFKENGLIYKVGAGPQWITKYKRWHHHPLAEQEQLRLNLNIGIGVFLADDRIPFLLVNTNISEVSTIGASLGFKF